MLADDRDRRAVLDAGVEDHPLSDLEAVDVVAERLDHARTVRAEDPRLRYRRQASCAPRRRGGSRTRRAGGRATSPAPGTGSGTSSTRRTSGPPSSWMRAASMAPSSHDARRAAPVGGRAGPRRRRRRAGCAVRRHRASHPRASGARPLRLHALHDVAPRGLVPPGDAARRRAHGRLRGALLLRAGTRDDGRARGGLPRYAWRDHYALLRERLDALGRRLGGSYRVLVDENHHVDRAGAERAGVGFIGKNTMLITRAHGSWVVLGTLVTDVELEASPPLDAGCGSCTLCIDACPTGALDEPGVLDSTRCLSYWTQTPGEMPADVMDALEDRVYGCDICQDVCPWNRGVEKRRAGEPPADDARAERLARRRGSRTTAHELVDELERLYVPRNDPRWLRRNALVALGNVGRAGDERARRALRRRRGAGARGGCASRRRAHRRRPRVSDVERLRVLVPRATKPRRRARGARRGGATASTPRRTGGGSSSWPSSAGRDVERLVSDPRAALAPCRERRRRGARPRTRLGAGHGHGRRQRLVPAPIRRGSGRRSPTSSRTACGTARASRSEWGRSDGLVVVDVTDDGPGLDPGLDPFAAGSSGVGSTGIGLWLARAIAVAHGGSLEAAGEGPGARFRLVLPPASAEG